jgi:hypothetical protein
MKVTKLIREYVTDEVSKVYDAKVNPYTKQAELDRKKLDDLQEELRQQQKEAIKKFMSENELFERHWGNYIEPYEIRTSVPSFGNVLTKAIVDAKKWEEENATAKSKKIRDIILNLELGATRQELDDMLSKLLTDN